MWAAGIARINSAEPRLWAYWITSSCWHRKDQQRRTPHQLCQLFLVEFVASGYSTEEALVTTMCLATCESCFIPTPSDLAL